MHLMEDETTEVEDYEDPTTFSPVIEYDETKEKVIKQMMDHTENNFGLGILSVPKMMENTLLKLLNKSQSNQSSVFLSGDISLGGDESDISSQLTIVDPIFRNPLVEEIVRNTSEPLPSVDHEPLMKVLYFILYYISSSSSETSLFLSMVQGGADKSECRVLELNQDHPGSSDQREAR